MSTAAGRRGSAPLRAGLRAVALAVLVAALPHAGAAQGAGRGADRAGGRATLTLDEARQTARAALASQPDLTRALAEGLVQANPADPGAHLLLSAAQTQLGNTRAGFAAGREAFRLSGTAAERYEAATLTALAQARGGNLQAAKFWLRRAREAAPDEPRREAAARQHQSVAQQARLSWTLSFAVAPTDNVNNGSQHDTVDIFGLPFTVAPAARALSGTTASLGVGLRYRLASGPQTHTELRAQAFHRHVELSSSARAAAPALSGSDFAFSAVEIGVSHRVRPEGWTSILQTGIAAGHNWYGGRDLSDYLRLDVGAERALDDRTLVFGGLLAERQWRRDAVVNSATVLTAQGGAVRMLGNGDRLRLGLHARDTRSDAVSIRHRALGLRLGWEKAEPVAGIRLSASFGIETRRYDPSGLAPTGRHDLRSDAELSLAFTRLEYMGFSPVLDLRASRARSNVAIYDGRDFGLGLGIRSNF